MMKRGFTLIELSIVLIIIGLLVGGVLAGRDLIRAAQLSRMVSDAQSYDTAMMTFKLKYDCLPGDCEDATNFLSGASGDGTGDGRIGASVTGNDIRERWWVWEHLSLAGLIEAAIDASNAGNAFLADNVPQGALSNSVACFIGETESGGFEDVAIPPFVAFGRLGLDFNDDQDCFLPPLTHQDAYAVDVKTDDGISISGSVRGEVVDPAATTEVATSCATYDLSSTAVECTPLFLMSIYR